MGSGRRVFAGKIVTVAFQVWTCLCYYSLLRTEGQHAHTSFPFHQNLNRTWFMTWLKCQDILWRAAGWPYSYNQSVRNQAFRAVWESIPVGPTTRIMYTKELLPTHPFFTNFGALNLVHWIGGLPIFFWFSRGCWWSQGGRKKSRQLMVLCCHQVGMHEEILQLRPPGFNWYDFVYFNGAYITE